MGRKRRIEIRISVHQTLKIGSPTSVSRVWCARCAEHVEMIEMERLNQLDPQALQASGIQIDADRLHVTSPTEGPPLVCLRSLMQ